MQEQTKRILVGHITGIYGIRGWLKIESYTRPPENIFSFQPWYIYRDDCWQEVTTRDTMVHGKRLIVALDGITDRDNARNLVAADISILRSQLVDLPPGEFYWVDLVGMQVVNQQGKTLGIVAEILETGANDVMVVTGQGRYLIPIIWNMYILNVEQGTGLISVDWDITE
jgi:16S rRNA processing protein RimM